MDKRPKSPLLVTVNVTGVCNLSCAYCYFQPRAQLHMPLEAFRSTLAALRESEVFLLTLSGGEPFLHPQIGDLLRLAHATFDHVSILTNGTALDASHLRTIAEIRDQKGFFPIQVSLDSADPRINDRTRGRTATALTNLARLKESGATITVAIVVSSLNVEHIRATIESLLLVTRHFHVMPIKPVPELCGADAHLQVPPERIRRTWDELIQMRRELGIRVRTPVDDLCTRMETSAAGAPCMAGFTKLAIDPNLDVRPCDKCVSTVVGNLGSQSLKAIWGGARLAKVFRRSVPFCQSAALPKSTLSGDSPASLPPEARRS